MFVLKPFHDIKASLHERSFWAGLDQLLGVCAGLEMNKMQVKRVGKHFLLKNVFVVEQQAETVNVYRDVRIIHENESGSSGS